MKVKKLIVFGILVFFHQSCYLNPIIKTLWLKDKTESIISPLVPALFRSQTNTTSLTAPSILSVSPTSGIEGDTVTITGTNFGEDTVLTFEGNVSASLTSRTSNTLVATIPNNGKSGNIKVTTSSLSATSAVSFSVYRYFVYIPVGTNLEIYTFNPNTGAVSAVSGSPFSSTQGGYVDPSGKFMYSAIFAAAPNNIKSYKINSTTGVLSPTTVPLSSANNSPTYMVFHPTSKFLYVSNYSSLDVSAFSIDQSTGNLTKINDYTTGCGCSNLAQLRLTPDGKYLYINGNGPNNITGYSIDQTTGALSNIGNQALAGFFDDVLIDPNSTFLYSVSSTGTISGFSINSGSGAITALPSSPFSGTANNMRGAMHPSGKYLYTVNIGGAQLAKHDIASDGTLSSPSTLSFGTNLQYVSIDPTGKYGFVNSGVSANYYTFSIDQTNGSTSLITGNPFSTSGIAGQLSIIRIAQ